MTTTKAKRKKRVTGIRRAQTSRRTLWLAQDIYAQSVAGVANVGGRISELGMEHRAHLALRAAEVFFERARSTRRRK